MKRLPVTVLNGFLGAGKTTVLNHLLRKAAPLRAAVIVNDLAEVNIDGQFLANGGQVTYADETLIELSNGCICCSLREDLVIQVERLARENRFDYLLIESTGIADPLTIARTFSIADRSRNIDLSHFAELDAMVTVVDAYNFHKHLQQQESGKEGATAALLVAQVEFANILLLNKTDLVAAREKEAIHAALATINPQATVRDIAHGQVDWDVVCGTERYQADVLQGNPKWALEQRHASAHGIQSFAYFERRPFHPERLWNYLQRNWPAQVLRSKGTFWIASRPGVALGWNQAGPVKSIVPQRMWWGSMPESERIHYEEYLFNKPFIRKRWDATYKDRMNELVFIGPRLKEQWMRLDIGACVCTDEEVAAMKSGASFNDPFPQWETPEARERFHYLSHFFGID